MSNQEAWLVRILINICRDEWRKRASKRRFDDRYLPQAPMTADASVESAVIARTSVWRALEQLAPRRRAAIVLFELEGVEIPKIAAMLGISAITVRWHLSRGRRDLARIIGDQERGSS
jgi:RNA polymerase sigma-70 factor (ECF subfamily)